MIEVTWDGRILTARGHSTTDPRVCAVMSSIAGTLFAGYDSPQPVDGAMTWDSSTTVGNDVTEFILNLIRVVSRQYPGEIQLTEVRQSATG